MSDNTVLERRQQSVQTARSRNFSRRFSFGICSRDVQQRILVRHQWSGALGQRLRFGLCNSAILLMSVLANMNGTYSPCGLAFAAQLPKQIPETIDLLTPETAAKILDEVMQ